MTVTHARPVLDPSSAGNSTWPDLQFHQIRGSIRQFGIVPDARLLQPADLLLMTRAATVPNLIRRAQANAGFAPTDAEWTHAALYTGDNMVVDANPIGGVSLRPMVDASFRHRMLVRRHPQLSTEDRYRVVVKALAHLRRGYSLLAVPRLAWLAWSGPGARAPGHVGGVTICSTLVADAFAEAVQVDFRPRSIGATWPADLSFTAKLDDVQVGWVRVRQ